MLIHDRFFMRKMEVENLNTTQTINHMGFVIMRQTFSVILLVLVLCIPSIGDLPCANDYGIEIGFSQGAQFHYYIEETNFLEEYYYVIVNEVNQVTGEVSWNDVDFTIYWQNGTEIPDAYDLALFWTWVPIGNWSYVRYLIGASESDWFENDTVIGINTVNFVQLYLKADGALYALTLVGGSSTLNVIRIDMSTTSSTSETTNSMSTSIESNTMSSTSETTNSMSTSIESNTTSVSAIESSTNVSEGASLFGQPEIILLSIGSIGIILIVVVIIMKRK